MTSQRVLIAIRDPVLAKLLGKALAATGRTVLGRIDPARRGGLFEGLALCDVLVMDARELRTLRGGRRAFLQRLNPAVRLLVVTTTGRLAEIFGLPSRFNGLLIVDPDRAIGGDQVELAMAGYCVLPGRALEYLLVLDWRRIALERLDEPERRILHLLGAGSRNSDIAAAMGCNEGRAKTLVRSILDKLGLPNRTIAGVIANDLINSRPGTRAGP